MKKLICENTVETLHEKGETTLYVDKDTIITPSAKDLAGHYEMVFCEDCSQKAKSKENDCQSNEGDPLNRENIYQAMTAMVEKGMFKGLFDETSGKQEELPYQCQKDPSGFKVVSGKNIRFETLETGVEEDYGKVKYQETIGAQDQSSVNSGFMTIDQCRFDWDVECEEIYYIVEGEIKITIDYSFGSIRKNSNRSKEFPNNNGYKKD